MCGRQPDGKKHQIAGIAKAECDCSHLNMRDKPHAKHRWIQRIFYLKAIQEKLMRLLLRTLVDVEMKTTS